jgi:membrane protein YdbS with pleckstrin-like domain
MVESTGDDSEILASVEFSKGLIPYLWIKINLILLSTIIGIVVMFFWVPFGWIVHKKQLENASLTLTKSGIEIRKGWKFKAQQNIPLDKLTDISIHEGPLLGMCNIVKIIFETAGGIPLHLNGLTKPVALQFRDIVMKQRDSIFQISSPQSTGGQETQSNGVLVEIRDILQQIDTNLSKRE